MTWDSKDLAYSRRNVESLESGDSRLDNLLDGGITTQSITEIYGNKNSGRTTMAHQFCVQSLLPVEAGGLGGDAVYIDTKGKFDPYRVAEIVQGLDMESREGLGTRFGVSPDDEDNLVEKSLNHIHVSQASDFDEQMLTVKGLSDFSQKLASTGSELRLVVIDSLTFHLRVEYPGGGNNVERRRKIGSHFYDLHCFSDEMNAAVVVTNATASSGKPHAEHIANHHYLYRLQIQKTSGEKRYIKLMDGPYHKQGEIGAYIRNGRFVAE